MVCAPHRFSLLPLTITSADADNSTGLDHDGVLHGKTQQKAVCDSREGRKFTGLHGAESLYTVRDSADAFPPLKSVAGKLCSMLEMYEV